MPDQEMHNSSPSDIPQQDLHSDLLLQTSKIAWSELQRFFAAGKVFMLVDEMDLVHTATKMVEDDLGFVIALQEQKKIQAITDEQAKKLYQEEAEVWCVVVRPFVLVQEVH